jgi:hypothetical protein
MDGGCPRQGDVCQKTGSHEVRSLSRGDRCLARPFRNPLTHGSKSLCRRESWHLRTDGFHRLFPLRARPSHLRVAEARLLRFPAFISEAVFSASRDATHLNDLELEGDLTLVQVDSRAGEEAAPKACGARVCCETEADTGMSAGK